MKKKLLGSLCFFLVPLAIEASSFVSTTESSSKSTQSATEVSSPTNENKTLKARRSSSTHPDTDKKGLNWDVAKGGAECYVENIVWRKLFKSDGSSFFSASNNSGDVRFGKAHDCDNFTYYTIENDNMNAAGSNHAQVLVKLTEKIRVADVEVVWANGYSRTYDVYAFETNPVQNNAIDESLLNDDNRLFSISDKELTYEPYFEVQSELQKKVKHDAEYILFDLKERGNSVTFGYYFDEIHVGAYDADYDTPHHLGIPDYVMLTTDQASTDEHQNLDVTVRNSRNAVLSDLTPTIVPGSVKTSWESPLLKKYENHETSVYATSQGIYEVKIDGQLSTGQSLVQGTGVITVNKNWKEQTGNFKSLVQLIYNQYKDNADALRAHFGASDEEPINGNPFYLASKAADGKEPTDDDNSRWSVFSNIDANGHDVGWDAGSAEKRKVINANQFWWVDLDKTYEITNVELIWERAYAPEYTVFGIESLPDGMTMAQAGEWLKGKTYEEKKTLLKDYILYEGSNAPLSIKSYPVHDEHSNNSQNGQIKEDNRTRYLLVCTNEPAPQDDNYFGFSLWEVYAWGADLTVSDAVNALSAPNTSVKAGYETSIMVTAYDKNNPEVKEDEWFPVAFSILEPGYYVIPPTGEDIYDDETGKKLMVYNIYEGNGDDKVLVAQIIDNDNGTYAIKAANFTAGQTKDRYDNGITDGSVNDISFTIQMTSTNTKGQDINGTFELVVYKNPMKAVTEASSEIDKKRFGVSDDRRRVYDDGYFDADVLKEAGNVSTTLTQIDLRNVDFTTDNDGNSLATVELPAPSSIKTDGVQMNPNAIYYVAGEGNGNPANNIHGQNVAFTRGPIYYIHDLRIYDGYDYQPLADKGTVALHARYSTNVPKNKRSIIVMPFVPRMNEVNREGKVVKFETMSDFNAEEMSIKATPLTNFTSENFPGKPLLISTESDQLYSKTGGYALTFHNYGYVNNSSYAADYTSGDGTSTNAEVAIKVPTDEVDLGNGAVLKGTYTKLMLDNGSSNFWLFSAADENFKPANDASFNYDTENGGTGISVTNQGQDLRNTVLPFFYYLEFGGNASSKQVVTFVTSDETTGISDNPLLNSEERNCGVYDLQGRKVADNLSSLIPHPSSQKGIYIVNGKKIVIK